MKKSKQEKNLHLADDRLNEGSGPGGQGPLALILQQSGTELKPMGPLSPSTRGIFFFYCKNRGAAAGLQVFMYR